MILKGMSLKKVICQDCKGFGLKERTETKSPGVVNSISLVCKKCHGCGWTWEKKNMKEAVARTSEIILKEERKEVKNHVSRRKQKGRSHIS